MQMFLSFTKKRLINLRAEALLSIKTFKIKDYCANTKNLANTIINLLFINVRYKSFVFNNIRSIHFIDFFSIDPCSRR
jgi:hypothetical protein